MNHETEEMLTALLDGQLTADQEKELRARLENETGLREIWEQLQSQRQLLRGLPRVKASDDFLGKVAVALQEQAPEVTLPPSETEEPGPRGGWRAVIALAAALAAVLLLGVFLWPRNAAQNSDQVASFDGNDRARQQQMEELKRLEKGDWVESTPVQRVPTGPLPKAAELAEGNAVMPGAAADSAQAMGALEAAQPPAELGENLQAQAAPADEPSANEMKRSARRDVEGVDSAGKQAAEIAGIPQRMSEFKGGDPPALAAKSPGAGVQGGFGAAAVPVGPIEVWIVDKFASTEPATGKDKKVDASQVEVFFASASEAKLPEWLSELQSSAAITRLDTDESRELLDQLAQQKQAQERRSDDKPAGVAAADLEGSSGLRIGVAGEAASNKSEELAAQVGYLGLQEAAPLDALLTRSQQRQLAGQKRVEQGIGGDGLVGGGAAGAPAPSPGSSQDQAKSSLESNLSNLRTRSVESQPLPQAMPPGGGRNVLIIIRER
jgi:hypothetical protein